MWIKAIKNGNFNMWLGFTEDLVKKYLDPSLYKVVCHLQQHHQGVQSTNRKEPKMCFMLAKVIQVVPDTGKLYSNLVGCFPDMSIRGNHSIYKIYEYDSNSTIPIPTPIKKRGGAEMT